MLDAHRDSGWVLFQTDSGSFCDLDPIGADVWALLAEPIALEDIVAQLSTRYAVDAETCARDVAAFLETLTDKGFVTRRS